MAATLEDLQDWKEFLNNNYEILCTSLNLGDFHLRHLDSEEVVTELECGILLGISCHEKHERASRFLSMIENDVASVKFPELVRVLENPMYRCSRPAAIFRKYAESKNILSSSSSSSFVYSSTSSSSSSSLPKPSTADMLNPCLSFRELTEMARSNPAAMSEALPLIISQRFMGRVSTVAEILEFIEGLHEVETQIIACAAIYDELRHYGLLPLASELARLADNVKRLHKCVSKSPVFAETVVYTALTELVHDLSPLIITGETGNCYIHSAAYQRTLITCDYGWPKSVFVYYRDHVYKGSVQIFPSMRNNQVVFRIGTVLKDGNAVLLYASDNPNPNSWIRFTTEPCERYVLWTRQNMLPANAEIYWKFVPVKEKANTFRILSAEFEDVMFVHKSATSKLLTGNRRVLLGMKGYLNHEHILDADQWTLECASSK